MHFTEPNNETCPYLFIDSSHQNKEPKTKSETQAETGLESNKQWKVLIVEDEALVAENIRIVIQDAGYIVADIISSGEDAVTKCSKLDPDLVIMDVRLRGKIDGIQAANLIHSTFKKVPIIFLTAYSEDHFPHISTLSSNFYRYVSKPYDMHDLPQSIENFLTEHKKK